MSDIDLTQDERKVLELLGKLHVSQSKKIAERLAAELFEKTYGDLRILLIL
jgi:hypothetical protein